MVILGRGLNGLDLATDSLIVGVSGLLDELTVGTLGQILTVGGSGVSWEDVVTGNDDRIASPDTFTTVIVDDTGKVTINPENAGGSASQILATFENVADGNQFNFTNTVTEIKMEAGDGIGFGSSSVIDVDIRFVPGSDGSVFFGEAGTDATISTSNGTTGGNFIILAGDGTAGAGGEVTLTPGTGTTTDGKVCMSPIVLTPYNISASSHIACIVYKLNVSPHLNIPFIKRILLILNYRLH